MICSHCNCDKEIPRDPSRPPVGEYWNKFNINLLKSLYCYHCENYKDKDVFYWKA